MDMHISFKTEAVALCLHIERERLTNMTKFFGERGRWTKCMLYIEREVCRWTRIIFFTESGT